MKNAISRVKLLAVTVGLLAGNVGAADKTCQWSFGTGASPANPDAPGVAGAQAVITPGSFSDGWIATNGVLGSAQGVWDLGKQGTIALQAASGFGSGVVTVKVTQYEDGTIYDSLAKVNVVGAHLVSESTQIGSGAVLGNWATHTSQWATDSQVSAITITGASSGSLVDSVAVSSVTQAPAPHLSIANIGGQVRVSWPALYSGMTLESSSSADGSQGWTPVNATVQVDGSTASVLLDAGASAQFYRLKQ